jgi:hypothetical protein
MGEVMHRKILTSLTVAILVGWAITSNSLVQGAAQAAPAWTLEEVLAGMDRASDGFRDMSAAVERAAYTAFLDNSRSEFGRMYFVRGDRSRIRISLEEPAPRDPLGSHRLGVGRCTPHGLRDREDIARERHVVAN